MPITLPSIHIINPYNDVFSSTFLLAMTKSHMQVRKHSHSYTLSYNKQTNNKQTHNKLTHNTQTHNNTFNRGARFTLQTRIHSYTHTNHY